MKALLATTAWGLLALGLHQDQDPPMPQPPVQVFQIESLLEKHKENERSYTRFLQVPALNAGIYTLPAKARDGQSPHGQDEVYYVLKGKATMSGGEVEHAVRKGSVIYVKAGQEHRFTDITEDLEILVLFSTGPTDPPGREHNER